MLFSKNIVLEVVRSYRGAQYLNESPGREYRWIAMLPEAADDMEFDILYVCKLSEAMRRNLESPGYHYLCIRDCFTDDEEDAAALNGTIVINEQKEISWLFNSVQQRFLQINDWVSKMQSAMTEYCDYQTLIDLCEPIMNNFVTILDGSYKLLAYTKNVHSSDPINVSLLEKGYHTEETMQKFKAARRFDLYEQEHGLIVSEPGAISLFECVSKWCRYGGEPLLHTVMVCADTPLSQALIELFDIFMSFVEKCFYREQRANPSQIYNSLLNEMLYDDMSNPFIIGERAKTSDIPFSGYFDAFRITFRDNATVLVGRFAQELMAYLPESKVVVHNYEISVLNIYSSANVKKQSLEILTRLEPLLVKYGAVCGVSEAFVSLPEFAHACAQATRAQTLGMRIRSLGNYWQLSQETVNLTADESSENVFFYNDVFIYLMLHHAQTGSFNVFNNVSYTKVLLRLKEYDNTNGTQLVQVLYAYLISERRATSAGRILHMHRNNVLYHISRIEELTDMNLDDYWVRLKLTLAFHFFELQESNRLFMSPINEIPHSAGD